MKSVAIRKGKPPSDKKAMAAVLAGTSTAKCKNCRITCPYKELNLERSPNHTCTVPKQLYYAKKYQVKEIFNLDVAKSKYQKNIRDVEDMIKIQQDNIKLTKASDTRALTTYGNSLALLSKLLTEVTEKFQELDNIGFAKDGVMSNMKLYVHTVSAIINEELEELDAQRVLGKIHVRLKNLEKERNKERNSIQE